MRTIETTIIDWSESVNPWYDSLNDAHNHSLHHAYYDYIQVINEEDYE